MTLAEANGVELVDCCGTCKFWKRPVGGSNISNGCVVIEDVLPLAFHKCQYFESLFSAGEELTRTN